MTDNDKPDSALLAYRYAAEAAQVLLEAIGVHCHCSGCQTCIEQRQARDHARQLLSMAADALLYEPPF